jgi:hypothetical protein
MVVGGALRGGLFEKRSSSEQICDVAEEMFEEGPDSHLARR